ncbi:NAD(+)/NADH kinase [Halorubrum luteum]
MSQSVRRVAVVGDDAVLPDAVDGLDALRDVVTDAGGRLVESPEVDGALDAIVAVGEAAVIDAALAASPSGDDSETPVLPVGVGRHAVPGTAAPDAIRQLIAGETRIVEHPVVSVSLDGDLAGRAAFDVALVVDEPARISEYGVQFPNGSGATVRADAVVVATPLGSDGYAGAAGGPVLEPDTGLAVVPVSPFTTGAETWVAPDSVTLSVERDGEPVSLIIDDTRAERVPANEPVRIRGSGRVPLLSTPAARDDR